MLANKGQILRVSGFHLVATKVEKSETLTVTGHLILNMDTTVWADSAGTFYTKVFSTSSYFDQF